MTVPDGLTDLCPLTSILPEILILLLDGLPITTLRVLSPTLLAIIVPDEPILTEDLDRLLAVAADNCIIPPLAFNIPVFEIKLFKVFPLFP